MGVIIDRFQNKNYGLLTEVKKGEIDKFGILVENDGYITPNSTTIRTIKESIEKSNEWSVPNPFKVPAVFQKFGIENANGRIYPEDVLRKQVEAYQKLIDDRLSYGELNHPETSTIDGDRISHIITELHWEKSTLVGELELYLSYGFISQGIISTRGDQTANLLLNGYKIGVSSRGIGSVKQSMGKTIVNDDFEIVCWDVVTTPSTPNAYMDKDGKRIHTYVESKTALNSGHSVLGEALSKGLNILR